MYPHERSLVKRLANKPFALLGVNSDKDREELKKVVEKEQLNWRSWWDGSISGPIAKSYGIIGWPTIYVLDANGVIQYVGYDGIESERVIDRLLAEMEKGRGS
jgi:hypothetical protein